MEAVLIVIFIRLIRACKAYYDIGLKQELPIDIVGEFYQATIDIRTSCRSFKQRKEQLNLLLQLLEIIADSLTHWHYDESWVSNCNGSDVCTKLILFESRVIGARSLSKTMMCTHR